MNIINNLVDGESAKGFPAHLRSHGIHHAADALLPGLSLENDAFRAVRIISIFLIKRIEEITNAHSFLSIIGCHLGDEHARADSVLVADLLAGRAPDALLIAEEIRIAFLLNFRNFAADVLESGECLEDPDAVVFADRLPEIAGDNRFDHRCMLRKRALLRLRHRHIGNEQCAGLIAVQSPETAFPVGNFDSHAVAVRVGCNEDFHMLLLPEFLGKPECSRILRVRERHRCEVRIRILLFRHNVKTGETALFHDSRERYAARAVERGVDDGNRKVQFVIRALAHGFDIIKIVAVHRFAENGDKPFFLRSLHGKPREIVE